VDVVADLPPDAQAAEPVQQAKALLNHPPVDTQPGAVRGAAAGDDRLDAGGPHPAAVAVVVVAAVGVDLQRPSARLAAPAAHRWDRRDQRQQLGDDAPMFVKSFVALLWHNAPAALMIW
jgi:hypothetical protein